MPPKKTVRKVNKTSSRGYGSLSSERATPEMDDRRRQGSSDRSKSYQRAKVQQKRDAVKRGAEGPKKSAPRKTAAKKKK